MSGYRGRGKAAPLAGAVGGGAAMLAAALALATPRIMTWEGRRTVTYLDIAGVPTACYGHTGGDVGPVGTRWSEGRCRLMLDADVRAHMDGARACVPALTGRPEQLAAATMLSFNIGIAAFCRSSTARRFNAGDWRAGCDAFGLWTRAGGRVVAGLVRRREAERSLCLTGL